MPRHSRLQIVGEPMYIVLRGHNHRACFISRTDYFYYLEYLKESLLSFGAELHAYALMPTHVHLLLTPLKESGASKVVQQVGRRYVQHFNSQYQCSGTLWEGRYKSALVDRECYLFSCYHYIEFCPVRSGLTPEVGDYEWSSYNFNACGKEDPIITPHPQYLNLATTDDKRQQEYRDLVHPNLSTDQLNLIKDATNSNGVIGGKVFLGTIESLTNVKLIKGKPGRPRKKKKE